MFEKSANLPFNRYIFCNNCRRETNHICMGQHYRSYQNNDNDEITFTEVIGFRLWICAGCEFGTLERYDLDSSTTDRQGNYIEESTYFPARTTLYVQGKTFRKLPPTLNTLYREILQTFSNNLGILCSIGIRALIEGICADKHIEGKNLEIKLDNMGGIIPRTIVEKLHSIRFIGNIAAHELSAPDTTQLRLAIEICEDLLNYLYDLGYKDSYLATLHQEKRSSYQTMRKEAGEN